MVNMGATSSKIFEVSKDAVNFEVLKDKYKIRTKKIITADLAKLGFTKEDGNRKMTVN